MKTASNLTPMNRQFRRRRQTRYPPLRLTPYAWAKLLMLRDLGETEIGGFGVSRPGDLLLVADVQLVRQVCTAVTVKFDDDSVANYFDRQVDLGRSPDEFARIWIHTHPGNSPYPSATDEETFARCFGNADWAIMLIVARGGQTYARLCCRRAPAGSFMLPVKLDFSQDFSGSDRVGWEGEYHNNVIAERLETEALFLLDAWDDVSLWDHSSQKHCESADGGRAESSRIMEFCDA
jgi:proteasome lid subunit RPN8/RPN11